MHPMFELQGYVTQQMVDLQLFNLWYGVPIIVHVLNQVQENISA